MKVIWKISIPLHDDQPVHQMAQGICRTVESLRETSLKPEEIEVDVSGLGAALYEYLELTMDRRLGVKVTQGAPWRVNPSGEPR